MNSHLKHELYEHLPYTVYSVAIGLIIISVLSFISELVHADMVMPSHHLYHIFHPLHLLFSTTATTAMFYKYHKSLFKASLVGIVGSVLVCGLSDIILPYIAGSLLSVNMHLHICILEHPMSIIPFVVVGIVLGWLTATPKGVLFSHSGHVLVSSMASLLYLISFGLTHWMHNLSMVFIYTIIAVVIPCCCSDIILPLLVKGKEKEKEKEMEIKKEEILVIYLLRNKGIKYYLSDYLCVERDSIVNCYKDYTETEAYEKLLQDINKELNIRAFYDMKTDDYLWIKIW